MALTCLETVPPGETDTAGMFWVERSLIDRRHLMEVLHNVILCIVQLSLREVLL